METSLNAVQSDISKVLRKAGKAETIIEKNILHEKRPGYSQKGIYGNRTGVLFIKLIFALIISENLCHSVSSVQSGLLIPRTGTPYKIYGDGSRTR